MTEYFTIKVPKEVGERHNERRKEAGLSWEDYLDKESVTISHDLDRAAIADDVAEEVVRRLRQ